MPSNYSQYSAVSKLPHITVVNVSNDFNWSFSPSSWNALLMKPRTKTFLYIDCTFTGLAFSEEESVPMSLAFPSVSVAHFLKQDGFLWKRKSRVRKVCNKENKNTENYFNLETVKCFKRCLMYIRHFWLVWRSKHGTVTVKVTVMGFLSNLRLCRKGTGLHSRAASWTCFYARSWSVWARSRARATLYTGRVQETTVIGSSVIHDLYIYSLRFLIPCIHNIMLIRGITVCRSLRA